MTVENRVQESGFENKRDNRQPAGSACRSRTRIPINDIAIAVIVAGSINARADFPRPRSCQPKFIHHVIQILMIDRIGERWRQEHWLLRKFRPEHPRRAPTLRSFEKSALDLITIGGTSEKPCGQ